MTEMIGALVALFFLGFLAAVVWWDVRHFRIPNLLNAAIAGLFGLSAVVGTSSADGLWGHVGAGGLAFCAGMFIYFRGWAGGGDAKLLGALVLWTGWTPDSLRLIVIMSLVGGVVSLVVWWSARRRASPLPAGQQAKVPYGVALAVAGFDFWVRQLFPTLLS